MSTGVSPSGSGAAIATPSPYLRAYWPGWDGSGNTLAPHYKSGLSNSLTANGTVSAGFWTNPYKPSYEAAATDYCSDGSTTNLDIGGVNTSVIVACRFNIAATTATAAMIWAKQESAADVGLNLVIAEISGTTAIRSEYKIPGQSSRNLVAGGLIDDGLDHSIIYYHDRNGLRGLYVDGVNAVTSGITDMTDSILAQSATSTNSHFIIGARGVTGAVNGQLAAVNATQKAKVFDLQVYTINGRLPSNHLDLIRYIHSHPYQYLTAGMWS